MNYRFLALISLLSFLFGCSRSPFTEGGIYATTNDNGTYSIIKILKIDSNGYHVRLYSNQLSEIPKSIDEKTLYSVGIDHKPDETLGMGHVPLSKQSFVAWHPVFVQQSSVKEDELEGYKMWLDAKGGYF